MSVIQWPQPMPERGRLPDAKDAYDDGKVKVCDPKMECPQTLHINLFFDGTNNNDAGDNPHRDSITQSHTNVARLFDAAIDLPEQGMFKFYMPGVGTPFPQIGESQYSMLGKGFAAGYGMRVAWGYTRVLNAIYFAITGNVLLTDATAYTASRNLTGDKSALDNLTHRYAALKAAHKQARDESRRHRTVRKVWINVFGFSRGAAEARSFVSRLVNIWARGGKIADEFDYEINFLGLFDTVASVGPPDSTRTAIALNKLDGHWEWTSNGQLNVPKQVRRCVHFFSIHEQRMSFPLDTIRTGNAYSGQEDRLLEVAYPGVHSDVGGGYPPGEQGKAFVGDSFKLSQIPLHDMYIEALRQGVPLQLPGGRSPMIATTKANFALAPELIRTFNDWLKTTPPISTVEKAMRFGMGQMLTWRTLRAHIGTADYVTEQSFFHNAPEGSKSREQIREETERLNANDPAIAKLKAQRMNLAATGTMASMGNAEDPFALMGARRVEIQKEYDANTKALRQNDAALERARERNAVKAAGSNASDMKPGNGPDDLVSNDKTDILEAAEEFRLLLTWLNPDQTRVWRTEINRQTNLPFTTREAATKAHKPETPVVYMRGPDILTRFSAVTPFSAFGDAVIRPRTALKPFLQEQTSSAAVEALRKNASAVRLYDDYVHDSRAWFRVPYFREYVPGGYFWARVLFTGGDQRVEDLSTH
jgi:hypothetical protein